MTQRGHGHRAEARLNREDAVTHELRQAGEAESIEPYLEACTPADERETFDSILILLKERLHVTEQVQEDPEQPRQLGYMHHAIKALKRDVESLGKRVKPKFTIAQEFKKQWQEQQERIVQNKEVDLERTMRSECAEKLRQAEAEAQAKTSEASEAHRLRRMELRKVWKTDYEALVRTVFEVWRLEEPGAREVRDSARVDELQWTTEGRVAAWLAREEARFSELWEQVQGAALAALHQTDEEFLVIEENARITFHKYIEDALRQQQEELTNWGTQLEQELTRAEQQLRQSAQEAADAQTELEEWMASRYTTLLEEHAQQRQEDADQRVARHKEILEKRAQRERSQHDANLKALNDVEKQISQRLEIALEAVKREARAERAKREREQKEQDHQRHIERTNELHRELASTYDTSVGGTLPDLLGPDVQNAEESLKAACQRAETAIVREFPDTDDAIEFEEPDVVGRRLLKQVQRWNEKRHTELQRMRRMKLTLCAARADNMHKVVRRYTEGMSNLEQTMLPELTALVRDVEQAYEVVHSLRRDAKSRQGSTGRPQVPPRPKLGSLVGASLKTVERLWDTTDKPAEERDEFLNRLTQALIGAGAPKSLFDEEVEALEQIEAFQAPPTRGAQRNNAPALYGTAALARPMGVQVFQS